MTRAKKDPLRFATFTWCTLFGDKSVYFLERNSSSESVGSALKLSPFENPSPTPALTSGLQSTYHQTVSLRAPEKGAPIKPAVLSGVKRVRVG